MKKLLLVTTAIAGVAMLSTPASAAIDLDVGGFFRGYVVDADSDIANQRETDLRRASELHVSGETTLDNGLTVGAHTELKIADADQTDTVQADEVYAYLSGGWGRVNIGHEDGAAYLLQVGAPSADSNVDGMRVYIEGHERSAGTAAGDNLGALGNAITSINNVFTSTEAFDNNTLDYDHANFNESDRLTYLSPKFSGFQAGISYAPEPGATTSKGVPQTDNDGQGFYDVAGADTAVAYEDLIEVSARYDGEFQGFGFAIGAGYSTADNEIDAPTAAAGWNGQDNGGQFYITDGIDTYNVGLNVMFQNFSIGGNYMVAETEATADVDTADGAINLVAGDIERTTYVIGGAYDNGPYHVGVSYLNQETEIANFTDTAGTRDSEFAGGTLETDKFTVGGGYSFGPGMTFRGSVAWGEYQANSNAAGDAVASALGDTDSTTASAQANDFTQIGVGVDVRF